MNIKDLKPLSQLQKQSGVKMLCYGPPGSGKTPVIQTAPNPVVLSVEPGMLSMRSVDHIPGFEAETCEQIDEFFAWMFGSAEAKQFDTLCIDSMSQIAELFLKKEMKKNKDGRKAYGEMAETVIDYANALYYMKNKHVYMIAKQTVVDEGGSFVKRPSFPGQAVSTGIAHLYDEILYLSECTIPGVVGPQKAFRTKESFDIRARDRSGMLKEFEPPNLTEIFRKCTS